MNAISESQSNPTRRNFSRTPTSELDNTEYLLDNYRKAEFMELSPLFFLYNKNGNL